MALPPTFPAGARETPDWKESRRLFSGRERCSPRIEPAAHELGLRFCKGSGRSVARPLRTGSRECSTASGQARTDGRRRGVGGVACATVRECTPKRLRFETDRRSPIELLEGPPQAGLRCPGPRRPDSNRHLSAGQAVALPIELLRGRARGVAMHGSDRKMPGRGKRRRDPAIASEATKLGNVARRAASCEVASAHTRRRSDGAGTVRSASGR